VGGQIGAAVQIASFFKRGRRAGGQIGVYITPEGVAAAHVVAGAKPRLKQCLYETRGTHDPFARITSRLPARNAPTVSVLEPAGYQLLLVEAPDVPADELRAAVRWRIKDLLDFHIDDAVIDVIEMPPHARGGPRKMMYAVTARAEFVKQQVELLESSGFDLAVIDIPELSLRNVATLLETEQRGAALLYLAGRRSTLLLVRQGILYLARRVETGAETLAEANGMRHDLVSGLALEVRRSLDYFESHYEQTSIPVLHTSGLEQRDQQQLEQELSVAVRNVDLARLLDTDQELSDELQRLCLPAVGAALRRDPVVL
jgi:MSHA biogenesis protein MshI